MTVSQKPKQYLTFTISSVIHPLFLPLDMTVDHFRYNEVLTIERAHIEELPISAAFASMGLGFALSLLIFMDQNIAEAMVNNPCNKYVTTGVFLSFSSPPCSSYPFDSSSRDSSFPSFSFFQPFIMIIFFHIHHDAFPSCVFVFLRVAPYFPSSKDSSSNEDKYVFFLRSLINTFCKPSSTLEEMNYFLLLIWWISICDFAMALTGCCLFVVVVLSLFLSHSNIHSAHWLSGLPFSLLEMWLVYLVSFSLTLCSDCSDCVLCIFLSFLHLPHLSRPWTRLKKGCAYHLDLFVVGILNGFLSIYGFPWMHGVLPHSPLHLRSLADVEERVDGGHVYEM